MLEGQSVNKEAIIQIFSGGFTITSVNSKEVLEKLVPLTEKYRISKVIIGWALSNELYEDIISYCKSKDIEVYFWFPIFSEIGLVGDAKLSVSISGETIESYSFKEEENFEFYCPSSTDNKNLIKKIYDDNIKGLSFDGVFIDKIRSSSAINGLDELFSCLCNECRQYYKTNGIKLDELEKEVEMINNSDFVNNNLNFSENMKKYFEMKQALYLEAILELVTFFRGNNLKVGADTYSMVNAPYVGQNLEGISRVCDFIKPMMYVRTYAPAGIQFEYSALLKAYKTNKEESIISEEKIQKEVEIITGYANNVYFGIEVNRIEGVVEVHPQDIERAIKQLETETLKGYVLSWDLMSMPEENINRALELITRR